MNRTACKVLRCAASAMAATDSEKLQEERDELLDVWKKEKARLLDEWGPSQLSCPAQLC